MDGQIIKLTTPVEAFGKMHSEIALREPTGALYLRLGEPRIAVASGESGGWYFVEQQAVINAYLDKLVTIEGSDAASQSIVLSQIAFPDAVRLKRALFSFFDNAAAKAAAENFAPKQ